MPDSTPMLPGLSSNGGVLLLREAEQRLRVADRMTACIEVPRHFAAPLEHFFYSCLFVMLTCTPTSAGVDQSQTTSCTMPHFHFVNEGVTSTTMSIKSGEACKFNFGMPASIYGNSGILSSGVSLRPLHGLIGHNTNRIYVYKPKGDFVGSDQFELKIRYNRDDGAGTHTSVLHVDVNIN